MKRVVVVLCSMVLVASGARAWVYPEHRDIALRAVLDLDSSQAAVLVELWNMARVGNEARLPMYPVVPNQPERPNYIDWAAWTAIGGDHSCSAQEMVKVVTKADWILDVARITEKLKRNLLSAKTRADRVNALRDQDIELQRADPDYATRAGSNNVHFLLPRSNVATTTQEFVLSSLVQGDEINALGVYIWYHYRALAKAVRLRDKSLTTEQRNSLALAVLADEAFGLHFLEDAFAAGHVAGTWGNASLRKGTHDYYNEHGLETATWDGKPVVLLGDAYMRTEDLATPAKAVRNSLEQVLDAYRGRDPFGSHNFDTTRFSGLSALVPDTLNVCANNDLPGRSASSDLLAPLSSIIKQTPQPALAAGYGELPRFRTELGPFVGFSPFIRAQGLDGGFSESQSQPGLVAGLGLNARVGFGLDGVTSESGDGLVFADVGLLTDNASTNQFINADHIDTLGNLVAAIPSRTALAFRLRMPFWLIPGDLILGAITVLPFSAKAFTQMAVVAGNGGVIPWQAGIATPFGRLQFVLGREVGANFYGGKTGDRVFYSQDADSLRLSVLTLNSVQLEFPIVELRPFRTFSLDQSSSMMVQLYAGIDIPVTWTDVVTPSNTIVLQNVYMLGIRIAFDWRYYM